ncbi:MAG TPA: Druantia anti-phage system protein DruA [Terriglobales bacterium]
MDRSCLIVLMSLRLAIPGELLSSIARFRFASQNHLWKQITCSSMKKQRTATVPLFACLTSRVHCNLQSIVNNGRFLILPWVQVKGLASKLLALSARRMARDWEILYGRRPVLLETLVDAKRFRGTCYRAANWIHVGQTTGRGRMDREHIAHSQAIKKIYVYPLARVARQRLCGD